MQIKEIKKNLLNKEFIKKVYQDKLYCNWEYAVMKKIVIQIYLNYIMHYTTEEK